MTKVSVVSFETVRSHFLRDNAATPERNGWPLGALEIANRQFATWTYVILMVAEVLTVLLPHHDHGVNLVSITGSTVSDTVPAVSRLNRTTECYARIQQFLGAQTQTVYLSADPINDPQYGDYHGLIARGCRGLTHLDGLHRLIAWGLENKRDVPAYVAGLI